ncbi:MAG: universal stress protein [Natronomonas sp.]
MYNRLLVPTDGSPGMARVFDHAATLATEHDAEIHLIYVVDTVSFVNMPVETSWEGVTGMLREEGSEAIATAKAHLSDQPIVTDIVEGQPSREISSYASRAACDLIVMGTKGRGGLTRLLLGSVAERVVRASTVPVLTVKVGVGSTRFETEEAEEYGIGSVDPPNATILE